MSHERSELAALNARRRQLVAMLTAEGNRLKRSRDKTISRRIQAHLRWLRKEVSLIETALQQAIDEHPVWRRTARLLQTVPGIGPVVARTLIAT